jgi:hypothetical protein
MTRSGAQAIRWGRQQIANPSQDWYRLCLMFVRMCFGVPMRERDAGAAWDTAQHKHPTQDAGSIPAGVPVFWELTSVADHVALSIGAGKCLSNDVKRRGRISVVSIDSITSSWGGQLKGWTEDLNGVRVYTPDGDQLAGNRVTHARSKLRAARVAIGQAADLLDSTPDDREVAHDVADQLDRLIDAIGRKLGRLPKR